MWKHKECTRLEVVRQAQLLVRFDELVPEVVEVLDLHLLAQRLHVPAAAEFGIGVAVRGTVVARHLGPRQIDEPHDRAGPSPVLQGRPFGRVFAERVVRAGGPSAPRK